MMQNNFERAQRPLTGGGAVIVALCGFESNAACPCVLKNMKTIRFLERNPVFKTSGRGSSSVIHTILDRFLSC